MRHIQPPDFYIGQWRQTGHFKITTDEDVDVGWYTVFINEQDGCPGIRMDFENAEHPIIGWEERPVFDDRQHACRYIACWANNRWNCLRVEQYYPNRIILKRNVGFRLWLVLKFPLLTRYDQEIKLIVPR
ncbi:MAG: hypothetical protein KGI60_01640 [Patescibacteria group bacterium]|nr:hypothetical protein [Patescibacteria group bacterium]